MEFTEFIKFRQSVNEQIKNIQFCILTGCESTFINIATIRKEDVNMQNLKNTAEAEIMRNLFTITTSFEKTVYENYILEELEQVDLYARKCFDLKEKESYIRNQSLENMDCEFAKFNTILEVNLVKNGDEKRRAFYNMYFSPLGKRIEFFIQLISNTNPKEKNESTNENSQNQQFKMEIKGIENKYLEIYFKKLFDVKIDFDFENNAIRYNGEKFNLETETRIINSKEVESISLDKLYFQIKKHLVDIVNLFLDEINRNILITKDKETKNEYLLSIQRKNNRIYSIMNGLISKGENIESLQTYYNHNFLEITSMGKPVKFGELTDVMFQLLNEMTILSIDTSVTFNEELINLITPDAHISIEDKDSQNTNDVIKKENLLKWNTSPNHFGHIINELINKGFLENLPMSNGETNYSEIARLFSSIIDFDTTDQYLIKSFNPNNEKISETVKKKFTIPELIDVKPKNSKTKGTKTKPSKTSIKTKKNK